MNKDIGKLVSLHPCVPAPLVAVSWGPWTQVRHAAHPRRGVPVVDHHDCVFSWEGCHVAFVRDLIDFHATDEGSRGHEILHHAVVLEFVLGGIGVVQTHLFKELLEVVRGQLDRIGVVQARLFIMLLPATPVTCTTLELPAYFPLPRSLSVAVVVS
jgi:hypothetical protein